MTPARSISWRPAALLAAAFLLGCNKPSPDSCRKAISNMQRLMGTDQIHAAADVENAVRSCQGNSKKSSVECAIQAQTLEQLASCPFYKQFSGDGNGSGKGNGTGSGDGTGSGSGTGK